MTGMAKPVLNKLSLRPPLLLRQRLVLLTRKQERSSPTRKAMVVSIALVPGAIADPTIIGWVTPAPSPRLAKLIVGLVLTAQSSLLHALKCTLQTAQQAGLGNPQTVVGVKPTAVILQRCLPNGLTKVTSISVLAELAGTARRVLQTQAPKFLPFRQREKRKDSSIKLKSQILQVGVLDVQRRH